MRFSQSNVSLINNELIIKILILNLNKEIKIMIIILQNFLDYVNLPNLTLFHKEYHNLLLNLITLFKMLQLAFFYFNIQTSFLVNLKKLYCAVLTV